MAEFVCSNCQCIESTSLANYFIQINVNRQKPLCCECSTGKHHNKFPKRQATIFEIMKGNIKYFEEFKGANVIKKRMISVITNYGTSWLPKDKFEKMSTKEVFDIYLHMLGK